MNWEAIGAVGEVLGAIGVIVTLGYLAVQIRRNTSVVRSTAVQSSNSRIAEVVRTIATVENSDVFSRGLTSPDELTDSERLHFAFMMSGFFITMDSTYWDYRTGVLPEAIWERELELLRRYLALPGGSRVVAAAGDEQAVCGASGSGGR